MSEWCNNRFEITGKSVCIDVMLQWINGENPPNYRRAILQSIQLFLAGYAGILKPVRTASYKPCQDLISDGVGQATTANLAFEQWLELLQKDVVLDAEKIRVIERLYHQTGLAALKWNNIPQASAEVIGELIKRQNADWFGLFRLTDEPDADDCWEKLHQYPERAQPCDMLMIVPPRLAVELNGNGNLLSGITTTASLYRQVYGIEWPAGHNVKWYRHSPNGLMLKLDSPWYPPSGEVIAAISGIFECEIRHTYSEPASGLNGYDCYDQGEHVDGYKGKGEPPDSKQQPMLYLVGNEPDEPGSSQTQQVQEAQEATTYAEVRG